MGADRRCVFCRGPAQGNYGIHRDGFGVGPEVDLCDGCGSRPTPTCEEIWDQIARPARGEFAHRRSESTPPAERSAKLGRRRQIA